MIQQVDNDFSLFQPTEVDRAELLAKLSDDVLMANIEEQLNGSIVNSMSYNDMLSVFEDRFQFILKFYPDDESILERCKEIRKDIYKKIYESIISKFSISSELGEKFYIKEDWESKNIIFMNLIL